MGVQFAMGILNEVGGGVEGGMGTRKRGGRGS